MLHLSNICEKIKLTKANILAGDTALGTMTLSIMTFSIKNLCDTEHKIYFTKTSIFPLYLKKYGTILKIITQPRHNIQHFLLKLYLPGFDLKMLNLSNICEKI
jgi:hypothetical protein